MSDKYILTDQIPVKIIDILAWARWYETASRQVARTTLAEDVEVSTVFLGIDQSFGKGPPLLFETRVFGGNCDGDMRRYATWDEAVAGHDEECIRILREILGLEETDGRRNELDK